MLSEREPSRKFRQPRCLGSSGEESLEYTTISAFVVSFGVGQRCVTFQYGEADGGWWHGAGDGQRPRCSASDSQIVPRLLKQLIEDHQHCKDN